MMPAPALLQVAAACALTVVPTSDYGYLVFSGVNASWNLERSGSPWLSGDPQQTFLAHGVPVKASYAREGQLSLDEGSIEFRLAALEDGSSDQYKQTHSLFSYRAPNGDYLSVVQASTGIIYLGGTVAGQWQSAYGSRALMWGWRAGESHHVMATWSASAGRMRLYLDGVLTADTNEGHYWPPADSGASFVLDPEGFQMSEVVLWRKAVDENEVRAHAARDDAPQAGEIWISTSGLQPGEALVLRSSDCATAYDWQGIPVFNPSLPSTLLPPGATGIDLTVQTTAPAECRYAIGTKLPFDAMQPLQGRIDGLSGDSMRADEVFIRCSNAPDYALRLLYRSLSPGNPSYPRKSNLWGSGMMMAHGQDFASKVDLYLGAELSASDIAALRDRNPRMLVLTSINTVENGGLPDDYYLHDTTGSKIEVWPGTYRLNLTKPYVAEYQARWAYQKMLDSGLMYDGCFFDNFFESQSWLKADIHGRPVQLDANEDGQPDDPAWLDAAWRDGVYNELRLWRSLMPYAYATGHLPNPVNSGLAPIFNGNSILFWATNVLDGKTPFTDFQNVYQGWARDGRPPSLNTIEASPQNQVAYGYGYDILKSMPASTQDFARDFYRYLRFPLAFTLMGDGYFHRDLGDILHGIDWWYDEYDFDLGYPEGPAELVASGSPAPDLLDNGGFEQELGSTWSLYVDTSRSGAGASVARDSDAAEGLWSVRIDVAAAAADWQVDFHQMNRSLTKGTVYDLSFWAKADAPRRLGLASQKGSPDWRSYGLSQSVQLGTVWQSYTVTFTASETVDDSRIQFFLGDQVGSVWLDGVELRESPPRIYRRFFTKGAVLLNATPVPQTVAMPSGYARFTGNQAPMYQYIVDDTDSAFSNTGDWQTVQFDSGQWKSAGPYYHHWGAGCRILDGDGTAEWDLGIEVDGTYSVDVWWAAAPTQPAWTQSAVYEIVAGDQVIATAALDQTASGDQWRRVATVDLQAATHPKLRLRRNGAGTLIADAVLVASEARFNDGSPADMLTLGGMDGVLLQKTGTDTVLPQQGRAARWQTQGRPSRRGQPATEWSSGSAPTGRSIARQPSVNAKGKGPGSLVR